MKNIIKLSLYLFIIVGIFVALSSGSLALLSLEVVIYSLWKLLTRTVRKLQGFLLLYVSSVALISEITPYNLLYIEPFASIQLVAIFLYCLSVIVSIIGYIANFINNR